MIGLIGAALPFLAILWRFRAVAMIGLLLSSYAFVYYKGDAHGRAAINARWTAAEKAMLAKGAKAREDAETAIAEPPKEVLDADEQARVPIGKPCKVHDEFDRDCSK
jgi:hypothetical protein